MMTFKAYLDNIKAQTGLTANDFKARAKEKGFMEPGVKVGDIVAWLKKDYGLGHGHAMAIVLVLKEASGPRLKADDKIDKLFSRGKSTWRKPYDALMSKAQKFGGDVKTDATDTYVSILKGKKKFAVIGVTADRMDIGLKLKGVEPKGRLEPSGAWNSMVTHRVRISDPKQVDKEVLAWLKKAHDAA
jgi:putative aminopeptidase FrvX